MNSLDSKIKLIKMNSCEMPFKEIARPEPTLATHVTLAQAMEMSHRLVHW